MKEYRIRCAQVRSTDPLVVRTKSGVKTRVGVDGDPPAPLKGDGDVRLVIDAGGGVPTVPGLPPEPDDFAPNYVQLSFQGDALATVDGPDLVVESDGLLWVTCGAELLPVGENWLREAGRIAIEIDERVPPPHSPV